MAKDINQVSPTTGVDVVEKTAKGAVKGAGATLLGMVALAGVAVAAVATAFMLPALAGAVAGGAVVGGAFLYAAAPVLAVGAGLGAAYALTKGISKMKSEQKELEAQARNRDEAIAGTIQAAQQQAYLAGARDGQVQVISKLQEIQAAQTAQKPEQTQEQQTSFASRVADKKNGITPEAIIQQREAAANTSPQVG